MKVLALSTAEQGGSLAIVDKDRLICEEYWDARQTHSKRLLAMIEQMIENRSGLKLEDLDALVAAKGPGSFTGLRIGISVIKGVGHALGKPTLGASSLDGIGFRFVYSALPVCVMMDARRNEVYSAVYYFESGRLVSKEKERVAAPEEILSALNGPALFAGSGSKAYQSLIEQKSSHSIISDSLTDSVCAVGLIQSLGINKEGFELSNHPLEPVYLRKSDAELNFGNAKIGTSKRVEK